MDFRVPRRLRATEFSRLDGHAVDRPQPPEFAQQCFLIVAFVFLTDPDGWEIVQVAVDGVGKFVSDKAGDEATNGAVADVGRELVYIFRQDLFPSAADRERRELDRLAEAL